MADHTGIEWTDATWNPIVGCSIVSPGCTNCYAMKMAARIEKMQPGSHYAGTTQPSKAGAVWTGKVALAPEHILTQPLRWARPRKIFVNSMGDPFHEDVPDECIDEVFGIMALAPQHTYQVLTKRSRRMRRYMTMRDRRGRTRVEAVNVASMNRVMQGTRAKRAEVPWPLPHVWLGVSAEDQERADERIPDLIGTPSAIRFISAEPLLGKLDLAPYLRHARLGERDWNDFKWPAWVPPKVRGQIADFWRKDSGRGPNAWLRGSMENGHPAIGTRGTYRTLRPDRPLVEGRFVSAWNNMGRVVDDRGDVHVVSGGQWQSRTPHLDWVIAGGESGPGARPTHPDWARSLRDQCAAADVPFYFKQWGQWAPRGPESMGYPLVDNVPQIRLSDTGADGHSLAATGRNQCWMQRSGKRAAGRLLDGVEHNAFPQVSP